MLGRELINQQPQSGPLGRVGRRSLFFPDERQFQSRLSQNCLKPTHAPQGMVPSAVQCAAWFSGNNRLSSPQALEFGSDG